MYPKLHINPAVVTQNVRAVVDLCAQHGLSVLGVSKGVCCVPQIAQAMLRGGVMGIGDSRVDNLMKIQDLSCEKWLIRIPGMSDARRVVRYADASLNSEVDTIRALNDAAAEQGKTHKVLVMYDLGDLREGYVDRNELLRACDMCMDLPNIKLAGIGANLNCLSFVQPDTQKMQELVEVANAVKVEYGLGEDFIVSGGNSASLHQIMTEGLPAGVNNMRLGESLLFGKERATYTYLPGTRRDAFVIETEVIEIKRKPSMPWGTIGPDSYGAVHTFEDHGPQTRAIVTGGNQDMDVEVMEPQDPRIKILASSCDHTVLDVTECAQDYPVGSTVRLLCGYHAALRATTSAYVEQVIATE